ncbi:MAG: mandelate racemase [Chloroflexi bacterium]|nr:mandelate racemase [Chloroflexota bacterium]
MDISIIATGYIVRIEWAPLEGWRPRKAGCNARLEEHGQVVRPAIARVTANDGSMGWGWSRMERGAAEALLGRPLAEACTPTGGIAEPYRVIEYPLLDLAGRRAGLPIYTLIDGKAEPLAVPCYDTSLYMDDLSLADDGAAAALIAEEARQGLARGHRHFKIKVGRGAMHMELEAGTRRDILVIRAVREAVGPEARLMIDANNGYNYNLARRVLSETADVRLYWLEEPFHEDPRLYERLKTWMSAQGIETLIADGEGDASPRLLDYARDGLIDVVQYDVLRPGFSRWLELGPQLDAWGVRSAPHHYGEPYGNYACGHLAAAIEGFQMVEWDEARVPELDASAYRLSDGLVYLPQKAGFGLALEENGFARAVSEKGFVVEV